jgi:hypothetical protein
MMAAFFHGYLSIILSSICVYLFIILAIRFFGKAEIALFKECLYRIPGFSRKMICFLKADTDNTDSY